MCRSVILFLCFLALNVSTEALNDGPIVGILSQETYIINKYFPDRKYDSFIQASYVKFLESAGARIIPIWIGQTEEYYRRVINYTNGVMFPGGGTYFNETGGYGEAATHLYRIALEQNNKGTYYPIWGICLGMQALMYAALNGTEDIRVDCSSNNRVEALNFTLDQSTSRLFAQAPADIMEILRNEKVTYNQHRYCLTQEVLSDKNMLDDWRILSTNQDENGLEFISSFEHKKVPFYGIQFHPEKNMFEFGRTSIPHSANSIRSSQYFANYFVNECRKNTNKFPNDEIESSSLIFNFNPEYIRNQSSITQIYVFLRRDFENHQLI
ncbi:gamma-glutamyl hydrolase A-like isoform X1 [Rhynchophorus ferrugineus]|uniref:gamma-glutamyl hydrolase A-like isoform X1 n=1 Tax=Rhynchophorus ferrugineus TaxID=354439 RepID=UPI003FCD3354